MKQIEVRVRSHDHHEPRKVVIDEEATIEDLLHQISPNDHAHIYLVVGDEPRRRERHERLCDAGIQHGHEVHCHPHVIHFKVDDVDQDTTDHILTPVRIMTKAGVDPKTHYLIQLIGEKHDKSYEGKPEEPIHMHEGMRFITASLGPTPVS